ncbi:MAG: hypothetical protein ACMZI0_18930 [Symbiopectobacterium sp.]|uniref:hypothetical protein n=1 Tax=Symbiopectobacterium sp. TaxID=2952789 RepID=UPI0039E9EE12
MKNKFTLLVTVLLLSGCTTQWVTQWVKNSANAEDFTISKAACEVLSEEKFPVKNEKYISGKRLETQSYVMDVNADSRQALFKQCMKLRGWTSETKWFQ